MSNKFTWLNDIKFERNLSNREIGCVLSHLKAISQIKELEGEYFLICEDDISFDNINLFQEDLNQIINNSPSFEILILFKFYGYKINNIYDK